MDKPMSRSLTAGLLLALSTAVSTPLAWAQQGTAADEHAGHHPGSSPAQADEWINAEVRRVDADAGKLTLRHEAIRQYDMAAMTMAFRVADPGLLAGLAVGDKVRFRVERQNQQLRVIALEKQP